MDHDHVITIELGKPEEYDQSTEDITPSPTPPPTSSQRNQGPRYAASTKSCFFCQNTLLLSYFNCCAQQQQQQRKASIRFPPLAYHAAAGTLSITTTTNNNNNNAAPLFLLLSLRRRKPQTSYQSPPLPQPLLPIHAHPPSHAGLRAERSRAFPRRPGAAQRGAVPARLGAVPVRGDAGAAVVADLRAAAAVGARALRRRRSACRVPVHGVVLRRRESQLEVVGAACC
ncbi:hypothetical protein GL218_01179 [Daldinia childiae]|uniref:uncharacterized protein n=1 Tax=Daldinia childiae TaxID=326645 RepID=UPI0014488DE9|nr:uncharacterized protein GL218_01179 [Daldinia childiae]KAF3064570.1 hypothetical protein GL218_01179 [Daldinia childiae]